VEKTHHQFNRVTRACRIVARYAAGTGYPTRTDLPDTSVPNAVDYAGALSMPDTVWFCALPDTGLPDTGTNTIIVPLSGTGWSPVAPPIGKP